MSVTVAILWSLPLVVFAGLHLIEYLRAQANPATIMKPPDVELGGEVFSPSPIGRRLDPELDPLLQNMARVSGGTFNGPSRTTDEFALSSLLVRIMLFPARLVWWAWSARTWRPLALLAALILVLTSPVAWFSGVGASSEAYQNAVAFARDAGIAAAVHVPLLIVIGAWPWWRWRGIIAGSVAAALLVAWLIYVLPASA